MEGGGRRGLQREAHFWAPPLATAAAACRRQVAAAAEGEAGGEDSGDTGREPPSRSVESARGKESHF